MKTRLALTSLAPVLAFSLLACAPAETETAEKLDVETVHEQALILDSHIDLELELIADDMDPWSSGKSRANLETMKAGGMDGAFLIIFSPQTQVSEDGYAKALDIAQTRYKAIKRLTEKHPAQIELALTAKDARRIHETGKRIALIGIENAYPFGNSVEPVKMWANRGVRYVGITHVGHNQFADSSNPSFSRGETESLHGGLSPLGRELVKELNKHGVMVDVSHAGKATVLQAIALSEVPVIASHSGVKGVSDNRRNLSDEELHALKDNGGVIQIVAYGPYLKDKTPEYRAHEANVRKQLGLEDDFAFMAMSGEVEDRFDELMKPAKDLEVPANVGDLVNHIDYVVKTIGIDHVGIASDFDGGGKVEGWMDASETMNVTRELVLRGYSQDDINKIWGGNLLRVLEAVEKHAAP